VRVYQSKLNGELLLAYEVYTYAGCLLDEESSISCIAEVPIGFLVECRTGYVGIFKSFEVLERQCEFIGEL
jgi:hypothetical protein